MISDVTPQCLFTYETFATNWALERSLAGVNYLVSCEVFLSLESSATGCAVESMLIGWNWFVQCKLVFVCDTSAVWWGPLVGVNSLVFCETLFQFETLATSRALEILSVNSLMFCKIPFQFETSATNCALEWILVGVNCSIVYNVYTKMRNNCYGFARAA